MPVVLLLGPGIDFMPSFTVNVTPYCVITCVFSHAIAIYLHMVWVD